MTCIVATRLRRSRHQMDAKTLAGPARSDDLRGKAQGQMMTRPADRSRRLHANHRRASKKCISFSSTAALVGRRAAWRS